MDTVYRTLTGRLLLRVQVLACSGSGMAGSRITYRYTISATTDPHALVWDLWDEDEGYPTPDAAFTAARTAITATEDVETVEPAAA
ncbi:hypothetical protein ACWDUL_21225 [Nocardia niigatensis]